jgi:molybdopterin-synthase adenylyltransferase
MLPEQAQDRFERQQDLVPQPKPAEITATVIGVGAIGRQAALQLAAIGTPKLQIIDFDMVDLSNVTTQGYFAADVGHPKVKALAAAIAQLDPAITVETIQDRYRARIPVDHAVFCCVDSIDARSAIWRSAGPKCRFWVDGRMSGEVIRVLAVGNDVGRGYPRASHPPSSACVANLAAGARERAGMLVSGRGHAEPVSGVARPARWKRLDACRADCGLVGPGAERRASGRPPRPGSYSDSSNRPFAGTQRRTSLNRKCRGRKLATGRGCVSHA